MVKPAFAVFGGSGPSDIIAFVVIFAVILALAYFTAKLVGKQALGRAKGKHIEIVDALGLGQDAMLYMIKAGGGFFLLAKCGKTVTMLAELDPSLAADSVADLVSKSGSSGRGFFPLFGSDKSDNFADKLKRMLAREPSQPGANPTGGAVPADKEKSDA